MIKYTFEFLECCLPRPAVTPIYEHGPMERMMQPEDPIGFTKDNFSPGGTVTVRVTAHMGEITASHDVQVYTGREVIEGITKIMSCAADAMRNYYRVEGWPRMWGDLGKKGTDWPCPWDKK